MEQYISKSALVAEIERLKERFIAFHHRDGNDWALDNYGKMRAYNEVLSFINTIEVKEVDLEKDSLTWQDINLIHHLLFDIKKDYDNGKLDKEEYYKEVLKQFKEQL